MTPHPQVAAVVLHYGSPDLTSIAVQSLRRSKWPLVRIIAVDNDPVRRLDGSSIGLAPAIILCSPHNSGFSAGMNLGIRDALANGATHVLLVNNDSVLTPECVGTLLGACGLKNGRQVGIAGPLIVARTSPDVVASAGLRFDSRTGRLRHVSPGRHRRTLAGAGVRDVDAVSGCVMLVTRETFAAVGLLDEAYFFSCEDVEFCCRARRAGFTSRLVTHAVAHHEGHSAIGARSAPLSYFAARNHLRLVAQAAPMSRVPHAARAMCVAVLNLAHALRGPRGRRARVGAVLSGIRDHMAGCYGPGRYLG